MKFSLSLLFCACLNSLFAQNEKEFKIKADEEVGDVLSFNDIYKYPSFREGSVLFFDGQTSTAKLNYNFLNGEMDFIAPTGDTLSIADLKIIKLITIDKDSFYVDKGYMQLISEFKTKRLAAKQLIQLATIKKKGAYDQPTFSGAETYGKLLDKTSIKKLVVKEDMTLVLKTFYYIGDRQNFYPANKKNFLKLFSKKEKEINEYINSHKISFSKVEDLKSLFIYINNMES